MNVMRVVVAVMFPLLFFCACSPSSDAELHAVYGEDIYYFQGLTALRGERQEEALDFFRKGASLSSLFFRRLCMRQLLQLEPVEEQLVIAEEYQNTWHDIDALYYVSDIYYSAGEYELLVNLTNQVSSAMPDNLMKIRLLALAQLQDPLFYEEATRWFSESAFSNYHLQFYNEFQKLSLANAEDPANNIVVLNRLIGLMDMRVLLYRRDYQQANKFLKKLFSSYAKIEDALVQLPIPLLSDAGKILLYGDSNQVKNALAFDRAVEIAETPLQKFYFSFYAGRLYDRSGAKNSWLAADRYEKAMQYAPEPENQDNALWYYLSTLLKIDINEAVDALDEYGNDIHDSSYFTDFFNTLSLSMATKRDWQSFYHVYMLIRDNLIYTDADTVSKYAYITARLIEEGLCEIPESTDRQKLANEVYASACIPGGNLYYSILAGVAIGLSDNEIGRIVLNVPLNTEFAVNVDAERLLSGFCDFGLYEYIYPVWQIYRDFISTDLALRLAHTLRDMNLQDNLAKSNALRIVAYIALHPEKPLSEAILKELYPRNFSEYIVPLCNQFGIPVSYMYALVRSESFFDPGVISYAGAEGLTQLMESTAQDIARKLKVEDFSLQDPETNLLFGTFYLEEMISRLDGSPIMGLCAYNAGITRVRRWQTDAADLPVDLMVETIPFLETREYAQKTVSAAVMYALLYDNIPSKETLAAMMK